MQLSASLLSFVLMLAIACVFVVVIRGSVARATGAAPPPIERLRNGLILGMVVVILVATAISLRPWPHAAAASGEAGPDEILVTASSAQWYWELSQESVPVGTPIHFAVTSTDVNHGFGVYDEAGTLLTQVQAMPGYVSHLAYTFEQPGVYRLLCLEYCGLAHHDMVAELTVTN